MNNKKVFLAIDLGAGSGRLIAAVFDGKTLNLEEISRWVSEPTAIGASMHWDVFQMFAEIKKAIGHAYAKYGKAIVSLAVDTWGVDYGLLDKSDALINLPYIYRDARTNGAMDELFKKVSKEHIYAQTGIQFMFFNTIFQLFAEQKGNALDKAENFLMMPDLVNWMLSGVKANERTNASTTQLYSPISKDWSWDLIGKMGLPERIFKQPFAPAGSILGELKKGIKEELGIENLAIVSTSSHDTASAIAGVPAKSSPCSYINSGTWSLTGMELKQPIINDASFAENYTNEVGVEDTIRFLKNITGMWLFQKSRESWKKSGLNHSFAEVDKMAMEAKGMQAHFNPDHADFVMPEDMVAAIQTHCQKRNRFVPNSVGEIARSIQESIALKYANVFKTLEKLTGISNDVLNIMGGGSKDAELNQMTADATGKAVAAGPTESTTFGNVIMQLKANKDISSLAEGREIIINSVSPKIFEPRKDEAKKWQDALENFEKNILSEKF